MHLEDSAVSYHTSDLLIPDLVTSSTYIARVSLCLFSHWMITIYCFEEIGLFIL
ncbi:unnamed protein product [Cylicocyclus nassatus]|uniref:Uncharacterized protein n=1 Tax=Cylicocyclus nassatus TaxID=53992 RepID=A0AA36DQC4_CYLNA|nr:unnamed protein product [Cylicocyclus nassatus]